MIRIIWLGLPLMFFINFRAYGVEDEVKLVRALVAIIHTLPPWRSDRHFTQEEWSQYIAVAPVFKNRSDEVMRQVLTISVFEGESVDSLVDVHENYECASKPFLLMRVLFDAKDAKDRETPDFAGWVSKYSRAFRKPSWPVVWIDGKPGLEELFQGIQGHSYDAYSEYLYFKNEFKFREFKKAKN